MVRIFGQIFDQILNHGFVQFFWDASIGSNWYILFSETNYGTTVTEAYSFTVLPGLGRMIKKNNVLEMQCVIQIAYVKDSTN